MKKTIMMKRADTSKSITKSSSNLKKGKKPTKQMLVQEKKIKDKTKK